jgi:hypothetical protein
MPQWEMAYFARQKSQKPETLRPSKIFISYYVLGFLADGQNHFQGTLMANGPT